MSPQRRAIGSGNKPPKRQTKARVRTFMPPIADPGSVYPDASDIAPVSAGRRVRRQAPPLRAYPGTYLLIAINVVVFAVMIPFGPLPMLWRQHAFGATLTAAFDPRLLIAFGSTTPDRILLYGEWWRLVTATFVHVSVLHLALNMWCLWNLGLFGEPLLGQPGLIAVYLLTGAAGMLQSLATSLMRGQLEVTAGASGAVFGIAGILIVLLSNRKLALPWDELRGLRRQVVFFALANLALGVVPQAFPAFAPGSLQRFHMGSGLLEHVDNSAHIGGLLCGLALGLPLFPRMTSGRSSYRARQVLVFTMAALALCLLCHAVAGYARSILTR